MSDRLDSNNKPEHVEDGVVVAIDYTLNVDGEIVDFSDKDEPLEYLQGFGQIIPGLEKALHGMSVGDSKEVKVVSHEAYGTHDPNAVVEVNRTDFPPDFPVEVGTPIQVRNQDGDVLDATITDVNGDRITLDFNHPLAGKDLLFNVTVVSLRRPSDEELAHGHAHGAGHDHDDEDDDEEYYDEEGYEDEDEDEDDGRGPVL